MARAFERAVGQILGAGEPLCSGFVAPVYSPRVDADLWVVTSGHAIREAWTIGQRLTFRTREGLVYFLELKLLPPDGGPDFALLCATRGQVITPCDCSPMVPIGQVWIRGSADGLGTDYSNTKAELLGEERSRRTGSPVLDLEVPGVGFSHALATAADAAVVPHAIWRGMSGAPIMARINGDRDCVIGVVGSMLRGGAAARVYGTPVAEIVRACHAEGLVLETWEPDPYPALVTTGAIKDSLRGVESPDVEQQCWRYLSGGMFRQGQTVISTMENVLSEHDDRGADALSLTFLRYFTGRLQSKAGRRRQAIQSYRASVETARCLPADVRRRVCAVIRARLSMEDRSFGQRGSSFDRFVAELRGPLEALGHDGYVARELSSILGALCDRLYYKIDRIHPASRSQLSALVGEHRRFSMDHSVISQQEVVVRSFEVLARLVNLDCASPDVSEEVLALARGAFAVSVRRRNAIFCVQMLMTRAIAAHELRRPAECAAAAVVSAAGLRTLGIRPTHEGVRTLHRIMGQRSPPLLDLFTRSYLMRRDIPPIPRYQALASSLRGVATGADMTVLGAAAGLYRIRAEDVPWTFWQLVDEASAC